MDDYINIKELVSKHPLYQAVQRCVHDELESYDYHNFDPCWRLMTVNYRIIVQEIFQVEKEEEVTAFLDEVRKTYSKFIVYIIDWKPQQLKIVFRFVISLPMCEYELEYINNMSASNSVAAINIYTKRFPSFKYSNNFMTEIENEEIINSARNIILSMDNKCLEFSLGDYAFHDYQLIPRLGTQEDRYRLAFLIYLIMPICKLLKLALKVDLIAETEKPSLWHPTVNGVSLKCRTDIVISKDEFVYCVIEVKKFPILPSYKERSLEGIGSIIFNDEKINSFMKQLICQMLYYKTDKGILTDSYISIFVELDLNSFERNVDKVRKVKSPTESKIVPIRYKIRDCHSCKPTLRESLLYFFYNSIEEDSKMVIKQERLSKLEGHLQLSSGKTFTDIILSEDSEFESSEGSWSRPSTKNASVGTTMSSINEEDEEGEEDSEDSEDQEDEEDQQDEGLELINTARENNNMYVQNGDFHNTQLVKLPSTYFKRFLIQPIDDNELLVAKIYDPRFANREQDGFEYTGKEIREICDEWYRTEKRFCKIMSRDPEFNSSYVRSKRGQVMITEDEWYVAKGYFNLFRYIESVPLPKDWETYYKVKKQLDIIHRNGVIHRDIKEDNILYTKDGEVYIIDFATAKRKSKLNEEGSEQGDLEGLKDVFYNLEFS